MDVCSIDWQLVSKFTPLLTPIVALFIFRQWNKQKGTEVIANEAKLLTYDLLDIKKIVIEIENSNVKDIHKLYNEYKSLCAQIENKINFLDIDLITNKNRYKLNNYIESKDKLLNKIKYYKNKKTENTLAEFLIFIALTNSQEDNFIKKFKQSIDEIISISKILSLYKKV
jgi:hypothetical protein